MSQRRALITGVNGQDGSYLADILLERGYEVHGLYRHSSNPHHLHRIAHLTDKVTLHGGDVTDYGSVLKIVRDVMPDEVYHEADQDHVGFSLKAPHYSVSVTVGGAVNVMEAIRTTVPDARVFLPGSATMFRPVNLYSGGLTEGSAIHPDNPYACAKEHVYRLASYYRDVHKMFVVCGILFSHDSPRRGPNYLLQRIARAAAGGEKLELFDAHQCVDVGHAREYMDAASRTLQQGPPTDYVIGTGQPMCVATIVRTAYEHCGLDSDLYFTNKETTKDSGILVANPLRAYKYLGWSASLNAVDMVKLLVDHQKGVRS